MKLVFRKNKPHRELFAGNSLNKMMVNFDMFCMMHHQICHRMLDSYYHTEVTDEEVDEYLSPEELIESNMRSVMALDDPLYSDSTLIEKTFC